MRELMANEDHELRLVAEPDGEPVAIDALILERSQPSTLLRGSRAERPLGGIGGNHRA